MEKGIAKIIYHILLTAVIVSLMFYLDILCLFSFYFPFISSDISELNIVLYLFSAIVLIFLIIINKDNRYSTSIVMVICLSVQLLLRIVIINSIEALGIKTDKFFSIYHTVDCFRLIGLICLIVYTLETGYRIQRSFTGINVTLIVLMIVLLQVSIYIDSRYYICLLTIFVLMIGVIFQRDSFVKDKQYNKKNYMLYLAIAIVMGNAVLVSIDVNNKKEISSSILVKHQEYISLLSDDSYWHEGCVEVWNPENSELYKKSHDENEYIQLIRQLLVTSQKTSAASEYWYVNGKYYGLQYRYLMNNGANIRDEVIKSSSFIFPHPKHSFYDNSDIVDELNEDIWITVTYTVGAETYIDEIQIQNHK